MKYSSLGDNPAQVLFVSPAQGNKGFILGAVVEAVFQNQEVQHIMSNTLCLGLSRSLGGVWGARIIMDTENRGAPGKGLLGWQGH